VWCDASADAIDSDDLEAAVCLPGPSPPNLDAGWSYYGALDLAVRHDRSAFLTLGIRHGSDRVRVCAAQHWRPSGGRDVDMQAIQSAIVAAHQRFFFVRLFFDPHQGEFLAQRLRRCGITTEPIYSTSANLDSMARSIYEGFTQRRLELFNDPQLVAD